MRSKTRKFVLICGLAWLSIAPFALGTGKEKVAPAGQMDDARRANHVLNRLTFGPRPGDVDRIRAMGIDPWIDQQLHPDSIDDSSLDARLAP